MALLHRATLVPSKLDLLRGWVPRQAWGTHDVEVVGAYRFDDPDGEVGIESHLLRTAAGPILHVPLTYRAAPLAGADAALVGTTQHSVLGGRWVYDACADPVYARALAAAVLTGGREATLEIDRGSGLETFESPTHVRGSGTPGTSVPAIDTVTLEPGEDATVVHAGATTITVLHQLGRVLPGFTLTGTWPGQDAALVLAAVNR